MNPLEKLQELFGKTPVVLELDLARGVLEVRPDNPMQALQLLQATTVGNLRVVLTEAAKNEHVRGLIVHATTGPFPMTLLDEVALEIERFGEHKPTAVWAESFGELMPSLALYKMATAAKEIWVQPTGMLCLGGVLAQILLLKRGLAKLGIEPQFGQRHEYKTAGDQFAADEVTEANREMTTAIVESVVGDAVATIASRRGIEETVVREAVDASPVDPQRALELGLIDHIGYRDEAYASILERWGAKREELRFVNRYHLTPDIERIITQRKRPKIGVVPVHGGIVTGRGAAGVGGSRVGADLVDEQLRRAMHDDDIRAVILDVDSPGGSAVASDFIRRAVLRLRESGTPVVARMGAVAASGGYYVAMGADEIVALPTTLTGSIGVVGGKMVTSGLYEKLGLVREAIASDRSAEMMSDAKRFDDEDWARLDAWLDRVYDDFTRFAAEDRGMPHEQLEPLARGRVWTGADALERGLVDYLGGHRVALERAALLAEVDVDEVEVVPVGNPGILGKLLPAQSSEATGGGIAGAPLSLEASLSGLLQRIGLPGHGVLTMPFGLRLS